MNAGLIRRVVAFLADFLVIAGIVSLSFSLLAQPLFINTIDDFDRLYTEYENLENERSEQLIALNDEKYDLNQALEDDKITQSEYNQESERIQDERDDVTAKYSQNNPLYESAYRVGNQYLGFSILYHVISFLLFHVIYMVIFKGHSIGRKLMKLKLVGRVNLLTIVLREFFWKFFYFTFTLGFGILIDIYVIILRSDKKTLRDYFSKTRVILEDIDYPL